MRALALPLALLLAVPAAAQPSPAGDWAGELDVSEVFPGMESLTVVFHVTPEGDGFVATIDSPDQGAYGLPVDSVGYDAASRQLLLQGQQSSYTGEMNEDGTEITGTWAQAGREFPLVLVPYDAPAEEAAEPDKGGPKAERGDYSGTWAGALQIPGGGEVRMTFVLARGDDGGYTAVLDAPGQAENLALGPIEVNGREVTIDIVGQASFTGTVSEDETQLEGTFSQGGEKLPMALTRN